MQNQKFVCPHHPTEEIINFCLNSIRILYSAECLEGLCATCVCEHTMKHVKVGTSPNYQNINETKSRFQKMLRDQMIKVGSNKEWLGLIKEKIDAQSSNVFLTLAKVRKDCLEAVNRHFDGLEAKVNHEIMEEKKKNYLHNLNRFETINNLLSKEFSCLVETINNVNSCKFVDMARYIQEKVLPSSSEFYAHISKELKENQIFSAGIIYRSQLIPELENSLKKLVNLQFIYPKVQLVSSVSKKVNNNKVSGLKSTMHNTPQLTSKRLKTEINAKGLMTRVPSLDQSLASISQPTPPRTFPHTQLEAGLSW